MIKYSLQDALTSCMDIAADIRMPRDSCLIGIMRGGAIPTTLLSDLLCIREVGMLTSKSYNGTEKGTTAEFGKMILPQAKHALLIDDIVDSGDTMSGAVIKLKEYYKTVKSVSLIIREYSDYVPDFFGDIAYDWVQFDWNRSDTGIVCSYTSECSFPWKNAHKCNDPQRHELCDIHYKKDFIKFPLDVE